MPLPKADGLAWTARPALANQDIGVRFTAGHFIAFGADNAVFSSTDGIAWHGHHLGYSGGMFSVLAFQGRIYAVGERGVILSAPVAPAVVQPPVAQIAHAGTTATLSVLAGGSALTTTYQWRKDGAPIDGATSATLTLPSTQPGSAGNYDVVVASPFHSTTSAAAPLTIHYAPVITGTAVDLTVEVGSPASFSVTVAGVPTAELQWFRNDQPIEGATATTYSIASATPAHAGTYKIRASNSRGETTFTAGTLALNPAVLSFTPATANVGDTVTIDGIGFTGATAVTFNNLPAASFTIASATQLTAVVPTYATTGRVRVTPATGAVLTSANDLTISAGPRFLNVAQLTPVGTGEAAALVSFTIDGTVPKSVLIRAIGPSLAGAPFNVTGGLADPVLTVFNGTNNVEVTNDDWEAALAADFATAGAPPLTAGSKDAAVVLNVAPGTYTVRVTGKAAATGTALVEVYDLSGASRVAHVATRTALAAGVTGSSTLVLGGDGATGNKTVLIRAIGSGLGLPGAHANPSLRVLRDATEVGANDDWGSNTALTELATATARIGAMPLATTDAAVLLSLSAGTYTVQVSGLGAGIVATEAFLIDGYTPRPVAPRFIAPLLEQTVVSGTDVVIAAPHLAETGTTFVWKKGDTVLSAATTAVLTLPAVTLADEAAYSVTLAHASGTVTSTAQLVVDVVPVITSTRTDFAAGGGDVCVHRSAAGLGAARRPDEPRSRGPRRGERVDGDGGAGAVRGG